MKIFKYPLKFRNPNNFGFMQVPMPQKAKIISAIVQKEEIVLYAEIFSDIPDTIAPRTIIVAPTGIELPAEAETFNFVDTVQQGIYVWHIYAEPSMRSNL